MDSYWGAYMAEEENRSRSVLPVTEQKSRGLELLNMLGVNSSPSDLAAYAQHKSISAKEVNVDAMTVLVKNSFIEVVMHPEAGKRSRAMTDSVLMDFESDLEKPWKSEQPWKQRVTDKLPDSDASTNASEEADDSNALSGAEARPNAEVWCASDYNKTATPMMYHQPQVYQCVESWWVPQGSMQDQPVMSWGNEHSFQQDDDQWNTTAMIRNMPNNYTREMLFELLDSMGFAGSYDFIYLPIDFKTQAGLGYAFVNFISNAEALRCFDLLEGFTEWVVPSDKVCTVVWGSPYQGLEAHIERYRNSPIMHHSVPDEWKPMIFEYGIQVSFPEPTKPIKAPKFRKQGNASRT